MFALIYQDERFLKTLHLTKRQLSEVPTFVYTQTSSLFLLSYDAQVKVYANGWTTA